MYKYTNPADVREHSHTYPLRKPRTHVYVPIYRTDRPRISDEVLIQRIRFLMKKYGLFESGWVFVLHTKLPHVGACTWQYKTLIFNPILLRCASRALIRNTILHEISHAILPTEDHHSDMWKHTFVRMGGTGHLVSFGLFE